MNIRTKLECLAAHAELTPPDATGMRFGTLRCHKCNPRDTRLCESILSDIARKVSMHEETERIVKEVVK